MEDDHGRNSRSTARAGQFPPPSTSIDSFLANGTDRAVRHMIDTMINISTLVSRHRESYGAYLGVNGPQYTMTITIAQSPKITVTELAKQLDVSSSFITVEVNKLIKLGIVKKSKNPSDARSVVLDLTTKGRDLLAQLGPVCKETNDLMYRSLEGDRAKVLEDMMDQLVADAKIALMKFERSHIHAHKGRPHL